MKEATNLDFYGLRDLLDLCLAECALELGAHFSADRKEWWCILKSVDK